MDYISLWDTKPVSVHIIGAGLAGLACAVRLTNRDLPVKIYEASGHAGGRCRSFFDNILKRNIDNGNHLVLSGNFQVMEYMRAIGALESMPPSSQAAYPFLDLKTGEQWSVQASWKLNVPNSSLLDLFSIFNLAWASKSLTVAETLNPARPIFRNLWEPLCVSILNTDPQEAAASLLWSVFRQTFGRGEQACRPCIAQHGLSKSLIDPALKLLKQHGEKIYFNERLKSIQFDGGRAVSLIFDHNQINLGPGDTVILALPIAATSELLPRIHFPNQYRGIVNVHFILPKTYNGTFFLGLIGGVSQWLFVRKDVASVTVSAADLLIQKTAKEIAEILWPEVLSALKLYNVPLPNYRVIKEKFATFAQTPEQLRLRPNTKTEWSNVLLAGDWTNTGLPATIEGAVTSGHKAAQAVHS